MTNLRLNVSILLLVAIGTYCAAQDKNDGAFKKVKPIAETYHSLLLGEVTPGGWLKKQINDNMQGFTGHLDELAPDIFSQDDIYGKDRLSNKVKAKSLGNLADKGAFEAQYLWWNSESQSNWIDGYIRSAILTNNKTALQQSEKYVNHILSTQDKDGYIGIYDEQLRYHFTDENGELWAKTTLYRALLAWYEYKKSPKLLNAIERAVQNVMDNYPAYASHPFYAKKPYEGGMTHGLVFTDVMERLYQLTGKTAYRDYCIFLYKDFSDNLPGEDAQYDRLLKPNMPLYGHGVHVYEHLRTVVAAYYASGNSQLKTALDNFLQKVNREILPSGAPAGDEFIGGRSADATKTGYEYCSLQELMNSYEDLLQKTGDAAFGDKAERLFFNAAQGARNPDHSSICYLKTDNSYELSGGKNGDTTDKKQTRYRYSPLHREAAVCCVPNAGRIAPYYVQAMWMKGTNTLVASLLGPCTLKTTLNGQAVEVKEETGYPDNYKINFLVTANGSKAFAIKIRKPEWATQFSVNYKYNEQGCFIVIARKWKTGDKIALTFSPQVKTKQDANKETYFTYGPLVLAHPIDDLMSVAKTYPIPHFEDLKYKPVALVIYKNNSENDVKKLNGTALKFEATMYNPVTQKGQTIGLVPMGQTILRQVTFKEP